MTTSLHTGQVSLTYNMNILQHIHPSRFGHVLVTLNPLTQPHSSTVQGEWVYEHPLYTPDAIGAQRLLPGIQGKRGITFAGAWTGYGFHEDGFTSGLRAAMGLGAEVPWGVRSVGVERPGRGTREVVVRLVVGLVQWWIVVLERLLEGYGRKREKLL